MLRVQTAIVMTLVMYDDAACGIGNSGDHDPSHTYDLVIYRTLPSLSLLPGRTVAQACMDGAWRYVIMACFAHQENATVLLGHQNTPFTSPFRAGRLERQGK
jgi:hypothetical protein